MLLTGLVRFVLVEINCSTLPSADLGDTPALSTDLNMPCALEVIDPGWLWCCLWTF